MKIVLFNPIYINKNLYEAVRRDLATIGHEFVYYDKKADSKEELIKRIAGADVILADNTVLDEEILSTVPNLKYIDVCFEGVDHIDLEYCKNHNIKVSNASGYATEAVAELELSFILSALRRTKDFDSLVRNHFNHSDILGSELEHKPVGIIGTGKIGKRLIELLKPFNCTIYAYSKKEDKKLIDEGVLYGTLEEIFRYCKVIAINVPLNIETKGMIDKRLFIESQNQPIIINAARGPIINKKDLLKAIKDGDVSYACLDVYDKEPPLDEDDEYIKNNNLLLTPHIGYFTKEAMLKRASIVFSNLYSYIEGKVINEVL